MTASQSSPVQIDTHEPPLSAPLRLSFDYTRSVGPLLSQFFTALRERRILGVRGSDGRVHVPPAEYDPVDYRPLTEVVPVASVGTVVSWTWQALPLEGQPLDRPFAWALIKLDGADTPLLHAIDVGAAGSAESISTGARVHVHWVDEPVGSITDIAFFALGDSADEVPEETTDDRDPVTFERLTEIVPVASVGTVVSCTWQPAPLEGQPLDRPFAWALIKLDGADTPLLHAVDAGSSAEISTGARVHAHWVDEPVGAITDIAFFALGEKDTAAESVEPSADDRDPVTLQVTPSAIEIRHTASIPETAYLKALKEGKLLGARTGKGGKLYFPASEAD
ncbi:MAG: uncharacterized protein QOG79_3593, partial [Mycobacterium sp.]|nr:uncharacterized protein [Mycobacterium sp.]